MKSFMAELRDEGRSKNHASATQSITIKSKKLKLVLAGEKPDRDRRGLRIDGRGEGQG